MSINFDKSILEDLKLIGLSEKESLVYIDLLQRLNPTGTTKVVRSTKLHGQFVYNALASLEEKGLVKHSVINGRKKFEANSPSRLALLLDAKKAITNRSIDTLLSFTQKKFEQSFEVFQGDASFVAHEIDIAKKSPANSFWYVISSQEKKFVDIMGPFMEEFIKISVEKNIVVKVIGVGADVEWFLQAQKKFFKYEYKMLPGLKEGASSLVIRDGNVSFESFEPTPLCYTIYNSLVSNNYKNIFEVLWGMLPTENKKAYEYK